MAAELHAQIASIVEVLANAAVSEICKAVEDGYTAVNVEMSRSVRENECLRRRVRLLELQVSRYRAEQRLKATEAPGTGRLLPGGRALQARLNSRETPAGSSLQFRSRFLNRPRPKSPEDQNQEVVTAAKTEPPEEDGDIIIVKVESSDSLAKSSTSASSDQTCQTQAQSGSQSEVSGSQNFTKEPHPPPPPPPPPPASYTTSSSKDSLSLFCDVSPFDSSDMDLANQQMPFSQSHLGSSHFSFQSPDSFAASSHQQSSDRSPLSASKKSFTCGICGKGFPGRRKLEIHHNVHTGERPFRCSVCDSWFSHPSNLRRHMKKKHLGPKTK